MSQTEPTSNLTLSQQGDIAVLTIDDGKANAISHTLIDEFHSALDKAEGARGLAVVGRPGKFSAGFDLSVVQQGPDAAAELMGKGAEVALRLFEFPAPVVFGVTGHALAMGAVLLACADLRIGADDETAKIGLNELAIGLPMPSFAAQLVSRRLTPNGFHESVTLARIYSPREAMAIGYLDEVVAADRVADTAINRATELAEYLDPTAFAITRRTLHGPLARKLRGGK